MNQLFLRITILFLLLGNLSFASELPSLRLDSSPLIVRMTQDLVNDENFDFKLDSNNELIDPVYSLRLDICYSDLIGQIENILDNNKFKSKYFDAARGILGINTLEYFPEWYSQMKKWAQVDLELLKSLNRGVVAHYYDDYGVAFVDKPKIFIRGRLGQIRLAHRYNRVANAPEGKNLLRYLSDHLSGDATIRRYVINNNQRVKRHINNYFNNYINGIRLVDDILRESGYPNIRFGYKLKKKGHIKFLKVKSGLRKLSVNTRSAILLFNTIEKVTYKQRLLDYIDSQLENELTIPKVEISDSIFVKYLSPIFIKQHLEEIKAIVKDFSYARLISQEDDIFVLKIRKWAKRNRATLKAKNIEWKRKGKPGRNFVIKNYERLIKEFPDRPWEGSAEILDQRGRYTKLGRTRLGQTINKLGQGLKRIFSLSNTVGLLASTGAMLLTANPYALTATYNLTKDFVYAKKFDRPFREIFKQRTIKNIVIGSVVSSGFVGGRIAHRIILGGAAGVSRSILTGRPLDISVAVGGITEGLLALLPAKYTRIVASGMDSNLKNAIAEIVEYSLKSGFIGFTVAILDDGDGITGFKEGVAYGAAEAVIKIAIFGFRYDPTKGITQEDLDAYANDTHNPILSEDAYGGNDLYLTMREFQQVVFRKDSLIKRLGIFNFFDENTNSFETGGMASMKIGSEGKVNTVIHEAFHTAQEMRFGMLEFFGRFFLKGGRASKFFEDYKWKYQ